MRNFENTMNKRLKNILATIWKEEKRGYNILIGGIFMILPLFVIALGFLMKKLENLIELNKKPARWDENWKELFIKGIDFVIIFIVFFSIPLFMIFLSGFFTTILSRGKIFSLFFFRGQVISVVMTILLLISLFLFPFALAEYVSRKDFRAAFNLKVVLDRIFMVPVEYLKTYATITGIYTASFMLIFLVFNWVMAYLLSGFILFFDGLVTIHLISKIYPRREISVQKKVG